MNRDELLKKVRKCTPDYTFGEDYPNLFGKYGVMVCGVCEYWYWYEEGKLTDYALQKGCRPLTDATDKELLEMLAITNEYWLNYYQIWYNDTRKQLSKFNEFVRKCNKDYFKYHKSTSNMTDKVLDSIYSILNDCFP